MDPTSRSLLLASNSITFPAFGTQWTYGLPLDSSIACSHFFNNAYYFGTANGSIIRTTNGIDYTIVYNANTADTAGHRISGIESNGVRLVATTSTGHVLRSNDGITWDSSLRPVTAAVNSFTFGNGIFVGVCQNLSVITSTDGINWSNITNIGVGSMTRIRFSEGWFVGVGNSGTVMVSNNGTTWSGVTVGSGVLRDVAQRPSGSWVIVGASGVIALNTNPNPSLGSWVTQTSGTTQQLSHVIWHSPGNVFIAGGNSASLRSSPDGITWTARAVGSIAQNIHDLRTNGTAALVTFNNTGSIGSTTNGTTWTELTNAFIGDGSTSTSSITFNPTGGTFLIYGNGNTSCEVNSTGTTVTRRLSGSQNANWGRVYYDNFRDRYIVMPGPDNISTSNPRVFSISKANGISAVNTGTTANTNNVFGCAFNATTAVIVGGFSTGAAWTTTDYQTYTARTTTLTGATSLRDVLWVQSLSLFVAVGNNCTIITSPDGITWTNRSPLSGTAAFGNLRTIVWTGSRLLTSGTNTTWTSTNGTTWTLDSICGICGRSDLLKEGGDGFVYAGYSRTSDGIAWNYPTTIAGPTSKPPAVSGGTLVCPSNGGRILRSTNYATWSSVQTASTQVFNAVATSGTTSRWVVVGTTGAVLTSDDGGASWTIRTSNTTNQLSDVIWTGTAFIACGSNGTIIRSTDGITWSTIPSGQTAAYTCLSYNPTNNIILATPNTNGPVLSSSNHGASFTALAAQPGGAISVYYSSVYSSSLGAFIVNRFGNIFTSTNGASWTLIGNVSTDNGIAFINSSYLVGTIVNGITRRLSSNFSQPITTNFLGPTDLIQLANTRLYWTSDQSIYAWTSNDNGLNWTPLNTSSVGGRSFVWTGEIFVSGKDSFSTFGSSSIFASYDGINFTSFPLAIGESVPEVLVANANFVVGVTRNAGTGHGLAYSAK